MKYEYRIFKNYSETYIAEVRDNKNGLLSIIGSWKTRFEAEKCLREQNLKIKNPTILTLF